MNIIISRKNIFSPVFMVSIFLSCSIEAIAGDYYPPSLLTISGSEQQLTNEDLDVFRESDFAPGYYDVRFFINNNLIFSRNIQFVLDSSKNDQKQLIPCFTVQEWESFGVILPADIDTDNQCVNINEIEYSKGYLDLNTKTYSLTLPQSLINDKRLRELEEQQWDNGIPAAFVNYSFSSFNNYKDGHITDSYYANIQTKINLGPWRLRNYSTWANGGHNKNNWNSISSSISRNINAIKSELTLGELYTNSQVFDSFKFKGLKLATDRLMEPYELNNYVPAINGIANSESVVTIVQDGQVIYQKSIPAGPFVITDYYPLGNGGNLYVNVKEADGSENDFIVPYSSIANLERKGAFKYSFATGKYDSRGAKNGRYVNQAEVFYGLTDFITLFGGTLLAKDYQAVAIGSGFNLGSFGAITTDMIHSRATVNNNQTFQGNAFRINYAKRIALTDTSVTLAGFRHFDADYLSLEDAFSFTETTNSSLDKLKNEYTLSFSQPLFDGVSALNVNSVVYQYASGKKQSSYNVGFSSSIDKVRYSLYYTYFKGSRYQSGKNNTYNLSLNVSVPLSFNDNRMFMSYGLATDSQHQTQNSARISGNYGQIGQGSWDFYQNYTNQGIGYAGGVSTSYRSTFANMNAGYAYNENNKKLNYGISGAVVGTEYGVLLAPSLQETNALILTKDTQGVGLVNGKSIETNASGLAIMPGISPYRKNSLSIDTKTLPEDVEIENNIKSNMIPTKGALVLADFDAKKGHKLLFKLKLNNQQELPVGAKAILDDGTHHLVSNFNTLYFVTDKLDGKVMINWKNEGEGQSCQVDFNIKNIIPTNGLYIIDADCR